MVTSGKNRDAEVKTEVKGEVIVTSGKNWDAEEKTEVKGEVIVTSGKNWDAEVKTEVKAEVKAPVERVVAIVQCGQAPVEQDKEVVDCSGCSLEYRQFLEEYGGKVEKLITLCQNHGVILKEKNCDKCGEKCRLDMQRKSFRCDKSFVANRKKRKRCNFVVSIYKGTWFDHTKLDIETHLKFVVLFLRTSFQYQIARNELSLSTMSINWWCSFCREVLISFGLDHHCDSIGGSGLTVEICESKYRKRKYNAGRVRDCQWIFCGFCRESRDFFMVPVQYRNEETLLSIIKDKIANGTTIISDCWKVYDCLQQEGYRHLQANQSINFVDPETKALTYTIERPWRNFTEHMPKYGRRTYNFVDYLATSYFKGHFKDARERFHHFLITAGKLFPPTPQGPQPVDNMKAMEPAAPMISVPAGVLKEFMSSTPSPTAASLVNDTTPTPSPKAPSLTRTPSPDLPNHCNVSALPTDKHPLTNGDMNSDSNKSDMEKNKPPNPINLGSSITVTSEKLRPESESVNAETDKNIVNNVEPEKKMLNGTIGTSLKRPSEEEEEEDDCSKYPDLKKIRVFAEEKNKIEDLRKVTNRLGAEQASRKGQYVAPIRIKRSVGIQAAPHIINKGLQHAQGQNSSIKTIAPRSSLSPLKPLAGVGGPGRIQNNSPNVAFHTKMIPGNNQNMLPGGAVGMLSTSQPGGRPQALSTSIIQGTGITTLANTTCPVGTVTHPAGSIGTVRPASGQMLMMTQSAPGMMQALPRPAVAGGVVVTANKTVVPVVQGRVVRSSVVPITNILSSGSILSTQRPMLIQNKEVTATTNAVNTPLFSRGSGVVDLTADEGRSTVGRTSTVLPAPGTLVKVPVTGTTQLVAIPQSGVVLLPNASAGAALVSGVQAVSNVANPIVAQARTGTVTSTPRGMGGSFRPISATSASSSVVAQHRHPAPLPRTPVQQVAGITKKLPPQPTLKLSHKDNSIVLSWTMGKTEDHEAIASYQLYAYQEGTLPPSAALWKKVGSVKALELPMACTLTQFMPGHVYHFAVRAVDAKSRLGPFSEPRSIRLEKK